MLTIAIQKSGRLSEDSLRLLADCGLRVPHSGSGKLKATVSGFPAELFFLRDDDIPQYVADGIADLGIVGQNVILEKGAKLHELQPLDFGKCRLSIALRNGTPYASPASLQGKRIATSYTNILKRWLDAQQVQAEIHEISGSVEIAPSVGLADAIFDIVSSGSTLLMNGLYEVETVLRSEAVLVASPKVQQDDAKRALVDALIFRMQAVHRSQRNKYILLNAPNEAIPAITRLLPGVKSPTILPLAESGWSSLHSVIAEDTFWEVLGQLKAAGAQGILVVPIEKMVV